MPNVSSDYLQHDMIIDESACLKWTHTQVKQKGTSNTVPIASLSLSALLLRITGNCEGDRRRQCLPQFACHYLCLLG